MHWRGWYDDWGRQRGWDWSRQHDIIPASTDVANHKFLTEGGGYRCPFGQSGKGTNHGMAAVVLDQNHGRALRQEGPTVNGQGRSGQRDRSRRDNLVVVGAGCRAVDIGGEATRTELEIARIHDGGDTRCACGIQGLIGSEGNAAVVSTSFGVHGITSRSGVACALKTWRRGRAEEAIRRDIDIARPQLHETVASHVDAIDDLVLDGEHLRGRCGRQCDAVENVIAGRGERARALLYDVVGVARERVPANRDGQSGDRVPRTNTDADIVV